MTLPPDARLQHTNPSSRVMPLSAFHDVEAVVSTGLCGCVALMVGYR
jgi:hypothetical protein